MLEAVRIWFQCHSVAGLSVSAHEEAEMFWSNRRNAKPFAREHSESGTSGSDFSPLLWRRSLPRDSAVAGLRAAGICGDCILYTAGRWGVFLLQLDIVMISIDPTVV